MKILAAAAVAVLISWHGFRPGQHDHRRYRWSSRCDWRRRERRQPELSDESEHRAVLYRPSMTTLRPEPEMKAAWEAMNEQDRAAAKQACQGNKDNRWSTLCNSLGTM